MSNKYEGYEYEVEVEPELELRLGGIDGDDGDGDDDGAGENEEYEVSADGEFCKESGKGLLPLTKLFPNALTLTALCVSLSSIKAALVGSFEKAVLMVIIAAFLDLLDGRFARLLKAESKLGENLDSLCDFINFGFCPAFIMYLWSTHEVVFFGWGTVMVSTMCAALRLAKFNTLIDSGDKKTSKVDGLFFFGVPSPAAGIIMLLPLILLFANKSFLSPSPLFVCFYVLTCSLLMVSELPTISTKKVAIRKSLALPILLIFGMWLVFLLIMHWLAIAIISFAYIFSIPVTIVWYYRLTYAAKKRSKGKRKGGVRVEKRTTSRDGKGIRLGRGGASGLDSGGDGSVRLGRGGVFGRKKAGLISGGKNKNLK